MKAHCVRARLRKRFSLDHDASPTAAGRASPAPTYLRRSFLHVDRDNRTRQPPVAEGCMPGNPRRERKQ
jgi:hypothetical protein